MRSSNMLEINKDKDDSNSLNVKFIKNLTFSIHLIGI